MLLVKWAKSERASSLFAVVDSSVLVRGFVGVSQGTRCRAAFAGVSLCFTRTDTKVINKTSDRRKVFCTHFASLFLNVLRISKCLTRKYGGSEFPCGFLICVLS